MDNPEISEKKMLEQRIPLDETSHFDREGFSGDVYIDGDRKEGFNSLLVDVHGEHPRKRMGQNTTRTYFVVEGSGSFTIGSQTFEVKPNDYFVIRPNGEYSYSGSMKLLETNISPDNSFEDEKM